MFIVIFSYNRPEMLARLLLELDKTVNEIVVIDDGSDWSEDGEWSFNQDFPYASLLRTGHEGKRGFWKKWCMARQLALGSNHDHFLFIPDDISNVDLDTINLINSQPWEDNLYAINVINCGRKDCWGYWRTDQQDFKLNDKTFFEVGFTDCGFLTNRRTMEHIDINQVDDKWFSRPDKSSGVGYSMTMDMRKVGVRMLMVEEGLCYHGDHESQMHGKFRKDVPLTSKRTR